MKIDWTALGVVSAVSVVSTVLFVLLLSLGVRFVSAARLRANQGETSAAVLGFGYTFIALAGLLVLFGIYLIVPQFH
ncbi:hypothetical protein GCM10009841_02450 [Microlunatus panaciterrae]|uniref:DUF4190 domain-containing protein n=1 Tax=Microlunatus panaciterrae TaxID=400768 RepID=A0ABS2RJB2_9ACTN|nr:hypothetical protein [Microlunatus panaciterrae]MBM7799090.1 hypothetical protein [Microlunatus panaciterrae]